MNWTENVIIADADYVDRVAFNLTVNFERMIGRRIPQADMARWVECIALDGGMRPSDPAAASPSSGDSSAGTSAASAGADSGVCPPTTQVVLIHDTARQRMENFAPGNYSDELLGKAFTGPLGEFLFTCTSPENLTTRDALLLETLQLVLQTDEVHRIMVIPDEEHIDDVRRILSRSLNTGRQGRQSLQPGDRDDWKYVTLFAMQPIPGGQFAQELLGYSLMAALGVKSSELQFET